VSTAERAAMAAKLKRRAMSLGAGHGFDYAMQFLVPIVLVRCLDTATFGEYRLLWLAMGTIMAVVGLGMIPGLFYFLPRSDAVKKRLYIHQTMLFLGTMGALAALAVSPLNPWLPPALLPLTQYGALVPVLVVLWVTSFLIDSLPTVDERVTLQACLTISIAALRVLLLAAGAFFTGDLRVMIWLLIALALLKLLLLIGYVSRRHGLNRPWFERETFVGQVRHCAPLGLSSSLFGLRIQADQWVAATLFTLSSFAALSVAAVLSPLVTLFRSSINDAFLPSMSRMQAAGDLAGMMHLNNRANETVALFLCPLLAFAFLFSAEIVTAIYTTRYIEAATVMRVYIIGMLASIIEIHSILLLLRQGPFAMRVNLAALAISVSVSWLGAQHFGLPGAAFGSVTAIYFDRFILLRRIAAQTTIRVRDLQHWRTLALTVALAIAAALPARILVTAYFASSHAVVKLAVGGAILVAVYGSLRLLLALPRAVRPAAPTPGPSA
jgi:O-antigen/teichoic acid export membrane protein